jgi:hypothetical protein
MLIASVRLVTIVQLDVVQVPLSKAVAAACDFISQNAALKLVAKTLTDAYMEDARLGLNRIPWELDSQVNIR